MGVACGLSSVWWGSRESLAAVSIASSDLSAIGHAPVVPTQFL